MSGGSTHSPGPAFLLAQIGAHAAARFTERLGPLGLTPSEAGVLWNLSHQPDLTQRALAEHLGAFPSRVVLLLDALEQKGLVKRNRGSVDRRSHVLRLTSAGRTLLGELSKIARQHQDDLCAALTHGERDQLRTLLVKIADEQGLRARAHPGFRKA